MKTLLAASLVAGALLLGATPARVGAAGGPHPAGFVPHNAAPRAQVRATQRAAERDSGYTCGGSCSDYEAGINRFFTDVAAASGSTSNVFSVATQYYDTLSGSQTHIAYSSTFGGSYVDTSAYPATSLCSDSFGGQSDPVCLTDGQLGNEILNDIAANNWPTGASDLFFIFTPSGVGICDGSGSASSGDDCSTNSFCAYHNYVAGGSGIVYAVEPDDATIPGGGCDTGEEPNNAATDPTIGTVSHEWNEAISDPDTQDGWFSNDAHEDEMADLCAWTFGATSGPNGAEYNQTINGDNYLLQEEYSNKDGLQPPAADNCVQNLGGTASPPTFAADGTGPLAYHGGPVMRTNTVYAIYWIPNASTPAPPANTALPVVSGVDAVGKTVSTTQGTWNTPVTYAYQWLRCSAAGGSCASISGAKTSSYRIGSADKGHTLEAQVSATDSAGTTSVASAPTSVVIDVPAASKLPRISGKAKVGKRLSAGFGSWSNSPTSFRYQWLRCSATGTSCIRISGATKPAYKLTKKDAEHRLRVKVTAVNAAGKTSSTSGSSAVVKR